MGFFKDFKDDFSQAVNELMPGEDNLETGTNEDDLVVNTLEGEVDVESELSKLDGLLEQVTKQEAEKAAAAKKAAVAAKAAQAAAQAAQAEEKPVVEPVFTENTENVTNAIQEEKKMADNMTTPVTPVAAPSAAPAMQDNEVSDETSIITQGTIIKGDIVSNGSLDIQGQVDGNVGCNGKLVVTGVVNGNSNASEIFADAAKIEGEVVSTGTVKIGLGSVIIGNVTSTSAVIAGAIKGDIDVQGPVVVDTSAVVMGNIKSRSVQINNGAVIEGFCSQCYSDVDVESLFASKKGM